MMKELNQEIRKANVDINKICKGFRNVEVLDLGSVSKFIIQGMDST
jgi:hypothetical protein